MKFRTLPIVAILFIAAAMVVQFLISSALEKEHVSEVVEYKMQSAQKDFFYVLLGFHNAADEMRKFVGCFRFSVEEPRTTQYLLESQVRVKPLSWKDWHIVFCEVMCLRT
jgi:hypothetical protein